MFSLYTLITNTLVLSLILSASMVILSKNPVHSVLWLILTFFNGSVFMLIYKAPFISMLFLVVYMGAIAVLFLFVIMMINIKITELKEDLITYLPLGLIIFIIFFLEIWYMIKSSNIPFNWVIIEKNIGIFTNWILISNSGKFNIEIIANILYTYKFYAFITASLILLLAMVGSIALTLNNHKIQKKQDIYIQLHKELTKSLTLKKYKSIKN